MRVKNSPGVPALMLLALRAWPDDARAQTRLLNPVDKFKQIEGILRRPPPMIIRVPRAGPSSGGPVGGVGVGVGVGVAKGAGVWAGVAVARIRVRRTQ